MQTADTPKTTLNAVITFITKVMTVFGIFGIAVLLGNAFNLIGWSYIVQIRYYLLMGAVCISASLLYFIQYRKRPIAFKYYTFFITLWPFFVLLSSSFQGGTLQEEVIRILTWTYVGAFFMLFYHFRIDEKMILWVLALYAITTATIQIMQQIDPLYAIFGGDPEDIGDVVLSGERNGLARFFVGSYHIQMLMMCFFWSKFLRTFRIYWGVLSALLLVSVYLYLTKQILISTLFTLALSFFMIKGRKTTIFACVVGLMSIVALAIFWDDLFGEMIQDSKDDSFSHGIRLEFIAWIMEYNLTDPIGVVFGHGVSSPWFQELIHMLYYPSDIGFFGEAIYYGWLWALAYFYAFYRILITYRQRIPLYLRLFVICSGIISVFIFPYRNRIELFNWICVIYICSLYIDQRADMILEKTHQQGDAVIQENEETITCCSQ